ncbi:hypothetical protein EHO60_02810 [Leptospira fletcheri]|uniref:Protein-tyrosine-phosphatase n=1 Tax=Leptospira fletcheri TaxID=2484981 RepID=A0A4R9GKY1_9LEPT|nr:hypothetical protein [Leptospira fletcheri]TGK13148.1 hypothetical protein EHO60_02810 [Leptospira fletcheri]
MSSLYESIKNFMVKREAEESLIPKERRETLLRFSKSIKEIRNGQNYSEMIFVCTHNSRRSQIAQMFALACAEYLGISGIGSYSGGTEVTAFHPNSVQALMEIGFKIEKEKNTEMNPRYWVSYKENTVPILAFSKLYSDVVNPSKKFIAVMVCSSADEACPFVPGAEARISLPYPDPKSSDDTPRVSEEYRKTCETIARELLFVMKNVAT